MCASMTGFYMGSGYLNSVSHVCVESSLPTEPSDSLVLVLLLVSDIHSEVGCLVVH